MASGELLYPKNRGSVLTFRNASPGRVLGAEIQGAFDTRALCRQMTAWEIRVLKRVGGYTRKVMRNSMKAGKERPDKRRVRKGMSKAEIKEVPTVRVPSEPGSPPVYWDSRLIKDLIYYFVDPNLARVVIGPKKFNRAVGGSRSNGLEVLEFGGTVTARNHNFYVEPRPYAAPAQEIGAAFTAKAIRESKPVF